MVSSITYYILVVAVLLGALYQPLDANSRFVSQRFNITAQIAHNVLLVTAHPDDESLFFAPTIIGLKAKPKNESVNLFHLCLSTGDAQGLGQSRKVELARSLDILGVPPTKRWIIDNPNFLDNEKLDWDPNVIADALKPYVLDLKIDTILTFDKFGVTSHPNHKSLPLGVEALIRELNATERPRLFGLTTPSLPFKYLSFASVAMSKVDIFLFKGLKALTSLTIDLLALYYSDVNSPILRHPDGQTMPIFVSDFMWYTQAVEAMRAHESQLVWFRYLNLLFSKFLWVNTWDEIQVKDLAL